MMVVLQIIFTWLLMLQCDGIKTGKRRNRALQNDLVATIIAMDIRLSENNEERETQIRILNAATSQSDVYMCTDKSFEHHLPSFTNVRGTKFAEQEIYPWGGYGGNTIQWWRLQQCWGLLREHEVARGYNYTFIAKLRTDCFRFGCLPTHRVATKWINTYRSKIDQYAFIKSDISFGGSHVVMEWISSLYQRIGTDYWMKDEQYVPLDFELISKCDFNAGKLDWMQWPLEPFGKHHCDISPGCFKRNLRRLKKWAANYTVGAPVATFSGKTFANRGISSEKVFVLDLLVGHFIIKRWHYDTNKIEPAAYIDDTIDGDVGIINYTYDFSNHNSSS